MLENERHGPQFCLSVADSLPPQCGGADIVGWNWKAVRHESRDGVKWGEYTVVGTWDGARLTLTEPPKAPRRPDPDDEDSFASPCPTPAGGWKPVDPAQATEKSLQAAMRVARKSPQYAGAWVDQSYLGPGPIREFEGNDPAKLVLNVRFTGDLDGHERRVREVWGGALCVSPAKHTEAELRGIQMKVQKEIPGIQGSSVDTIKNRVSVTVFVVTDELRNDLDSRYGPGTVRAWGVLEPVAD
ncbi:hypothetical protein ABGB12_33130 [Actinocorallia sp. B10E7]|uniref:hypothetical protein n=1 Tax=Actinocorallia sp. B10E7 TaxID=3153558 RepID=UPI00325E4B09